MVLFRSNSSRGSFGAATIWSPTRSMVLFWSNSSGGSLGAHHTKSITLRDGLRPDRVKFNDLFTVPVRPGSPVPGRSLWHLVTGRTVQNHPDPKWPHPQNTDLDVLNPTILFIWRETAGKGKIIFHPTSNKALSRAHYYSYGDHYSPHPGGVRWLRRIMGMPRVINGVPTHISNETVYRASKQARLTKFLDAAALDWLAHVFRMPASWPVRQAHFQGDEIKVWNFERRQGRKGVQWMPTVMQRAVATAETLKLPVGQFLRDRKKVRKEVRRLREPDS